jgi:predicted DCC family thiol-disulfide oxidoreductase YuxK
VDPDVQPAVVVIDGECGLCSRAAHYGMQHGTPGMLRFVASQSDEGQAILQAKGLVQEADETMVAVVGEKAYLRSAAVVQVAKRMKWPWRAEAALWLVPKPVRDAAYMWVSRRRKRFN